MQSLSLGGVDRPATKSPTRRWPGSTARLEALLRMGSFLRRALAGPPEPFSALRGAPYSADRLRRSQVGRLLAYLDAHQLARNTVVVVMGDHGGASARHGEARTASSSIRRRCTCRCDSGAMRRWRGGGGRGGPQHRHPADGAQLLGLRSRTRSGRQRDALMTGAGGSVSRRIRKRSARDSASAGAITGRPGAGR